MPCFGGAFLFGQITTARGRRPRDSRRDAGGTENLMNIRETLRGALRRIAGMSSAASLGNAEKKRRTLPLPSIFNSYGPPGDIMPKPTAYNLRRFSEIPVPRRAINTIKDRIAGMRWR